MSATGSPFRDELGAAVERAERLARENAALRRKVYALEVGGLGKGVTFRGIDWVVLCIAVPVSGFSVVGLVYPVATW
jgi:hypothetical protein